MTKSTIQDNTLINALLNAQVYKHPVDKIQLIETHISWVILTGLYAYKIKKPLNLGFLDFSSLEKRKQCCEQELSLNNRTAPDIYLEVITINGTIDNPQLSSEGDIIEYAVKMNQFPQQSQLDKVLLNNELDSSKIDSLSLMIAKFHQSISVADTETEYGNSIHVLGPMNENLKQIRERIEDEKTNKLLNELEQWINTQHKKLLPILSKRKQQGYIRECHGDLHLRNLAWINNKPVAFDCIEFNPYLRWIDVMSDISFLVMDLQARNHIELSYHFLNTYLEATGDYNGTLLLPFYMMYRALVRAKVDAISMHQSHTSSINDSNTKNELYAYLKLAKSYMKKSSVKIIITHGLSASGKTTFSKDLLALIPAIRIRSDVERKRMVNLKANNNAHAEPDKGIYTKELTNKLYNKLALLSESIINAGYSVMIDAAFLDKAKRDQFRELANDKNIEFIILNFTIPESILRQRIIQRTHDASDADISVLETQLLTYQPLDNTEQTCSYNINLDTTVKDVVSFIRK